MTNDPRVFYMGEGGDGGSIHMLAWRPPAAALSGWHHKDLTGDTPGASLAYPFSSLAAMGTGTNRDPKVYYLSGDGHVHTLAWAGGDQWVPLDLTQAAGAPAADRDSGLAAMGTGENLDPKVYYLSGTGRGVGHVHTLVWVGGDQWVDQDLTQTAGAPAAALGSSVAVGSPIAAIGGGDNSDPHVFVRDTEGHVQQLAWTGSQWVKQELDVVLFPLPGNGLTAMSTGTNHDPKVYYLSSGDEVSSLVWVNDFPVHWDEQDVTRLAGAPSADSSTAIATVVTGQNDDPKVYYFTPEGHVQELIWESGFNWLTTDLSKRIGAPPSAASRALTATVTDGDPRIYYLSLEGDGGHVQELAWLGQQQQWVPRDVTEDTFAPRALTGIGPHLAVVGVSP